MSYQKLYVIIKAMLGHAPCNIGDFLHINIVDDATIAKINKDYLLCHGPTNVLSFPIANINEISTDNDIANIFFSIDTFHRECFLYKQEPIPHMLWLLAHAMGHLCNMDHGSAMDTLCTNFYNIALAKC